MELLNTVDVMDIAFHKAYDSNNIYFRMDSTIVALEKSSGELLWEYGIEQASPIGTHKIWVFNDVIIYGAVEQATQYQVLGIVNKNGEDVKLIKTPHRICDNALIHPQKQTLEFLSLHKENAKRYYCSLDVQSGLIQEIQTIDQVVESIFMEDEELFFGGGDGIFKLEQNGIKKVYEQPVFGVIQGQDQTWIVEELNSTLFGLKKWGKTNDLMVSFDAKGGEKSILGNLQVFDNKLYVPLGEGGGLHCYDLATGQLIWVFGKDEMTINSYTISKHQVFVVAETVEADILTAVLDATTGSLTQEIPSEVEPEYITLVDTQLYISGLLGIEVHQLTEL